MTSIIDYENAEIADLQLTLSRLANLNLVPVDDFDIRFATKYGDDYRSRRIIQISFYHGSLKEKPEVYRAVKRLFGPFIETGSPPYVTLAKVEILPAGAEVHCELQGVFTCEVVERTTRPFTPEERLAAQQDAKSNAKYHREAAKRSKAPKVKEVVTYKCTANL